MGFYNYRFLNEKQDVIYVGKTKQDLSKRIYQHFNVGHLPNECYKEAIRIEYIEFETEADMDFMEIYFINCFQPRFNKQNLSGERPRIRIEVNKDWVLFRDIRETEEISKLKSQIDMLEKQLRNDHKIMEQLKKENNYAKVNEDYGIGFKVEREMRDMQFSKALDIAIFEVIRSIKRGEEVNPSIAMIIEVLGNTWFGRSGIVSDEVWFAVHDTNERLKAEGVFDFKYIREAIQSGVTIEEIKKGEV